MGPKICLGGLVLRVSRGPGRELTDVNVSMADARQRSLGAVCITGHVRSFPLPAVHMSIRDNVLKPLRRAIGLVSVSAALVLQEENATNVDSSCSNVADARKAPWHTRRNEACGTE